MAKKQTKARSSSLKLLLVERGFFVTEGEAERWVMAGKVLVDGQRIDKAGIKISSEAEIRVIGRHRYASRGGYKLAAVLDYFQVDVTGRVVVDCGASTGGFTDCLLQRNAAFVYAVDTGFGQLLGQLRLHPSVRNLERTNLSDLLSMTLDPPPSLVTLDLSYLSLTKALPITAQILAQGEVLALFKPLFEVDSPTARRTGKIDDPALLVIAFQHVFEAAMNADLIPIDMAKLALQPKHGVNEFFLRFAYKTGTRTWNYDAATLLHIIESPGIGSSEED